ncbi:MAG: hypothetical protein KGO02_18510, partial [Alphaproteobacteria bacterium]|nr:hypothetical protein [Alphaproteobacteria bacterium]
MGSAAEFAKDRDGETAAARSVRAAAALSRIFLYSMNYAPELTGVGRYSGELGSYLAERVA